MRQGRRARYMARDRGDPGHAVMVRRRFSTGTARCHIPGRPCYVGPNIYDSIAAAARANDMKYNKLWERLKAGKAQYRGMPIGLIELPEEIYRRYYRRRTWEWDGKTYDTQRQWVLAVAETMGCSESNVWKHYYRNGNVNNVGRYAKVRTYERAAEKMATAPRPAAKPRYVAKKPPPPKLIPCDRGFFLGDDEFAPGSQVAPSLASVVNQGGGVWKGAKVRVPQTAQAAALYRELLVEQRA